MEETQNEEQLELRFSMNDVLTALQHMSPEGVDRILKLAKVGDLVGFVNQEQIFWDYSYAYLEALAEYYKQLEDDFRELNGLLNASTEEKTDRTISDIAKIYKEMDVENKMKLTTALQKENSLADAICLLFGSVKRMNEDIYGTKKEL